MYLGGGIVDNRKNILTGKSFPGWKIDPGSISQDLPDRGYPRGPGVRSAPEKTDPPFCVKSLINNHVFLNISHPAREARREQNQLLWQNPL